LAVRGPLVAVEAPAAAKDRPAVDPGSDMRILRFGESLRRVLRPAVIESQRAAAGRVLDVRGPLASGFAYEGIRELVVDPAPALAEVRGERYDTVCSFGAMSATRCLEELVETLLSLTAPGGRLLFVELDGDASAGRRRLDRGARRLLGMSMARDISGALWAGGFEIASLDRRPLRSRGPGFLRFVVGAARPDPDRADGGEAPAATGGGST
jgi:hypothetical protein